MSISNLTRRSFLASLGLVTAGGTLLTPTPGFPQDAPENRTPTASNIEGPFYRPGAPFRNNIRQGAPGTPLIITGRLLSTNGSAIRNAIVDAWQCDNTGAYDNTSADFRFRGRFRTSRTRGSYRLITIKPPPYRTGPRTWRPSHIHFKASFAGFRPLTTQLYFVGDQFQSSDPFFTPLLAIPLRRDGEGVLRGTFDIVLQPR